MSKLMAVVWNVNTHSSAPTTLGEMRVDVKESALANPRLSHFLNEKAKKKGWTRDRAVDYLAKKWADDANQRDPFTGLAPTARAGVLATAVKAAANWAWSAGCPDLVFVAPEYLFAHSGHEHLLSGGTHLAGILAGIQSISQLNPHVLLFPGTIAYREPMRNQSVQARVRIHEDIIFRTRNAKPRIDEMRGKIEKIAMRDDDHELAQNKAFVYLGGKKMLEYTKRGDFHEVTRTEDNGKVTYAGGSKSGTFRAFDKLFGIEVCLDHNVGYARFSGGADYDVHVITSADVEPVEANEKTVGSQPGKVGFVVHASSNKSYTQVVRRSGADRKVLSPIWEDAGAGHGRLYGYELDFGAKRQDTGVVVPKGKVSSMKAKFSN